MKTLKTSIYKNIVSILVSDNKEYRNAQSLIIFARTLTIYPSKAVECLTANRLISFYERNINSVSLILEIMKDEGEEEEIIQTVEFLHDNPTIKTKAEVVRLISVLSDYIKYANILKVKNSFLSTLDMIEDEDNIKNNVDTLYQLSNEIVNAYNSANFAVSQSSFDTQNPEAMKVAIAEAIDVRKPDKVILTGIRGLNSMLSPGYLSGSVYVYAGLPGNYKSGILLESHIGCCKYNDHLSKVSNKKPISMYISMENTMSQTVLRLWALLYPNADISMFSVEESTEMIDKALSSNGVRSVILYYGYREKSTYDVSQIILSYNDEEYEVVALFLDYIKRIRPGRTDAAATGSEKAELHAIMNELKHIAGQLGIPIVTGHQLNRMAATAVDSMVASGGYNKTDEALGRSQISVAWEIMEVADFLALINIENNGEVKSLMIKAVKQRDIDSNATDTRIVAIRHPFISPQSFALIPDINETYSMSVPVFFGKQVQNYMSAV